MEIPAAHVRLNANARFFSVVICVMAGERATGQAALATPARAESPIRAGGNVT